VASGARLADGVQILGEVAASGFKEPPSLARRADGQMIQLPPLLHEVLVRTDGQHDDEQIAAEVSESVRRQLTADDVQFLINEKLQPMGLVVTPGSPPPPQAKANGLLALRFRTAVLPERATAALAAMFKPLFLPFVVVAVIAGLVTLDVWLFGIHGIAQPLRQTIVHPALMLLMLAIVIGSAAFHETGHAAGCAYGGAKPGKMGCGLYLAWPAFYTDITDSYRLDRRGRLRADLGGIYFNAVSILVLGLLYALTHFEPLLLGAAVIHLEIAHQLIPVVRLDGYYIVADLTGVPDLFGRLGPILSSALPWRPVDPRVTVLKRWVRVAVTTWVLFLLPVIGAELVLILMNLPRIYSTGYDTARHLAHQIGVQSSHGHYLNAVVDGVEIAFLALPLIGIALMLIRAGRAVVRGGARMTDGRPVMRMSAIATGVAALGLLGYSWVQPANHRPISPHDRGTFADAGTSAANVVTGNAAGSGSAPPTQAPAPAVTPTGSASPGASQVPAAGSSATPTPTSTTGVATQTSATPTPTASASLTPTPTPTATVSASSTP